MKTRNTPIEDPEYSWPYSDYPIYSRDEDDEDDDEDEDADERGDWGTVDPLEHPGPPSDMDPSAPGSAV